MHPGIMRGSVRQITLARGREATEVAPSANDMLDLETINITNLTRYEGAVKDRCANVVFVQEHTTKEGACKAVVAGMRPEGYSVNFGPVAFDRGSARGGRRVCRQGARCVQGG